jgi:hypothetical protein
VTAVESAQTSASVQDPGPGPTVRTALLRVLPIWAASRIAVALLAAAGSRLVSGGQANQVSGFAALWDRWDVQLFWKVARYGYLSPSYSDRTEVDFPGMPLALRAVHLVLRDWVLSGIVISLLASLAACVALYLLAGGGRAGDGAVLALIVFPYSVFLFAGYSEGLFLAFATWAWWAARRDRWLLASVLACGATVTRIIGIPLLVALLVEYLVSRRSSGRPLLPQLGWLVLPALPIIGFVSYLRVRTGRWDAYSEAMRAGWHRDISFPWVAVHNTWSYATDAAQPSPYLWFWRAELLAVLVGVVVTALLARERRWGEATFVGASCLLMSSSTYLASGVRAVLVWFPLFLLLGRGFAARPWLRLAYLTLSVPLAAVLVLSFTSGQWVD